MAQFPLITDRTCMVIDTAGGQNLNAAASTLMAWNSQQRNPDTDTYAVDLPNNRVQLKRTGWYMASCNVSCISGGASSFQGGLKFQLAGVDIPGAFSSPGFIYTPIGMVGVTMCIPMFVFENTVADQYLTAVIARLATSSGTINTFANGSFLSLQHLS